MFHRAIKLDFLEGVKVKVTFQDGKVRIYDMAQLFGKYPQLKQLRENRELFLSGKLDPYGITWNDELDIEAETIYREGEDVGEATVTTRQRIGAAISEARSRAGLSQKDLAAKTGIDQADISKIENGHANPSLDTLDRIAKAIGATISFRDPWAAARLGMEMFTDDFLAEEIQDSPAEEREFL